MNDIREDLKAYLDGELPEARATEVAAALAADPLLQNEVDVLRAIGEGIRGLAAEPSVHGFERTLAAVTRRRRSPWRLVLNIVAAVGATAIIGAVVVPLFAQAKYSAKRLSVFPSSVATGAETAPAAGEADSSIGFRNRDRQGWSDSEARSAPADSMGGGGAPATAGLAEAERPAEAKVSAQAPATFDRLVIQNADLSLRVDDAVRAQAQATALAKALGGFVESSSVSSYQRGLPVAEVTMRVPAKSFEVALDRLRSIEGSAEVLNESLSGDDVTAQVADVEARLKVLRGEEEQYLEILKATTKIGDVLAVKERLSMVRQQIESYDAQRKVLRDQAALSTIHVMFEQREAVGEPEGPKNWAGAAWAAAVNGLRAVGTWLGQAGIFLFVFSPIWLPVVLLAWWLARRSR